MGQSHPLPQTFIQACVSPTPGSEMGAGGVMFMFQQPFSAGQRAGLQGVSWEWQGPREPSPLPQVPDQKMGSGWVQARDTPAEASPLSPHPAPCNQRPPAPQVEAP